MPTTPSPPSKTPAIDCRLAKERVVRSDGDWWLATIQNVVSSRAILGDGPPTKRRGGVRQFTVKITVEVMCKLEKYLGQVFWLTIETVCGHFNGTDVAVSISCTERSRACCTARKS